MNELSFEQFFALVAILGYTWAMFFSGVDWTKYKNYNYWFSPIVYQAIWIVCYLLIVGGWFIFAIYLDFTTDYMIALMTITISLVFFLKVWPILYFNFENAFASGTVLAWVLFAHAGVICGLSIYRGVEENQDVVAAVSGTAFGLLTLWLLYISVSVTWLTTLRVEDKMNDQFMSGSYEQQMNQQGYGYANQNYSGYYDPYTFYPTASGIKND